MLSATYQLLKTIKAGIKHESFVQIFIDENGLSVRAEIICTKDRKRYAVEHIFSEGQIRNVLDESTLVKQFVDRANHQFRLAYEYADPQTA